MCVCVCVHVRACVEWIYQTQDRVPSWAYGNEFSDLIKGGEFLEWLVDHQLPQNDAVPRSWFCFSRFQIETFFPTWPISTGPTLLWVLLDFLQVIVTANVCLAPVIDCSISPTCGVRRNTGRASGGALDRRLSVKGGEREREKKLYLNFASSPSISKNASPRDVRYQSIDETLHLHSHIIRRVDKFQTNAEAPLAAKIMACWQVRHT